MMSDSIRDAAAQGLQESSRLRLRFWKRAEINAGEAERAVDRVDALAVSAGDRDAAHAAALGRVAATTTRDPRTRLATYREALSIVAAGASSCVGGAAGMAVRLLDRAPGAGHDLLGAVETIAAREHAPSQKLVSSLKAVADAGAGDGWALQQAAATKTPDAAAFARHCGKLEPSPTRAAVNALPAWPDTADVVTRHREVDRLPVGDTTRHALGRATLQAVAEAAPDTAESALQLASQLAKAKPDDGPTLAAWALARLRRDAASSNSPWLSFHDAARKALPSDEARAKLDVQVFEALAAHDGPSATRVTKALAASLKGDEPAAPLLHILRTQPELALAADLVAAAADDDATRKAVQWLGDRESFKPEDLHALALHVAKSVPGTGPKVASFLEADAAARHDTVRQVFASFVRLGAAATHPDALVAGLQALSEHPTPDLQGLALVAQRMARATPSIGGRLCIARGALEQARVLAESLGDDVGGERVRILQRLSEAEDDAIRASQNRGWFQSSTSLLAVDLLRSGAALHEDLGALATRLTELPWATPGFVKAVAEATCVAVRDEAHRRGDALMAALADDLQARARQIDGEPKQQIQRVREALHTVSQASRGVFGRGARQQPGEDGPIIEDEDDFITIGGVRVPKSGIDLPEAQPVAATTLIASKDPLLHVLPPLPAGLPGADTEVKLDWQDAYHSGHAGVYNPFTGEAKWSDSYKSGVAGVFNPLTGNVDWHESYKSGIGIAWNPRTVEVVSEENYHSGLALAYNPATGKVDRQEAYHSGVAGVYDPQAREVVWQEAYKSGVAGVYDGREGRVVFQESYHSGIGCVSNDPEYATLSGQSFPGFDDD